MAGSLSGDTTVLSNLSVGGANSNAVTYGNIVAGVQTSSPVLSVSSRWLSLITYSTSQVTATAAGTIVRDNEVFFVIAGASGATLGIRSGGTVYLFNSAASMKLT